MAKSIDDFLRKEGLSEYAKSGSKIDDFLEREGLSEYAVVSRDSDRPLDTLDKLLSIAPDLSLNLAQGAASTAGIVPTIARFATDEKSPFANDTIYNSAKKTTDFLGGLRDALEKSKSDFSHSEQQNPQIISKDDNGDLDFNAPSISQVSNIIGEMLPSMGIQLGVGGKAAQLAGKVGGNVLPKLIKGAGYGAGNAAITAPQAYAETYDDAYKTYIEQGKSEKEADKLARAAADISFKIMAPLSAITGGVGGTLASESTGNVLSRFAKGFAKGSPFGAIEEGAQPYVQDQAIGRESDPYNIASQAALGALFEGIPEGAIGVMHGKPSSNGMQRGSKPAPETPDDGVLEETTLNAILAGEQPAVPAVIEEETFDPETGEVIMPPTEESIGSKQNNPVDIPVSEPTIIDQINSGTINAEQVRELLRSGEIVFKDGRLQESPKVEPQEELSAPQQIVDAVNSGAPVDSNTVREFLRTGKIRFNEAGKLEPTVNPEQMQAFSESIKPQFPQLTDQRFWQPSPEAVAAEQARPAQQQIQQDMQQAAQGQSTPLLPNMASGVDNINAAHQLRRQSLDTLINHIKEAATPRNIDDTNAVPRRQVNFTKAAEDYYTKEKLVNDLKQRVAPNEQPIRLSKTSNAHTFLSMFDTIANRNAAGLDSGIVHDLIDNDYVAINDNGHPEITPKGQRLHENLNSALRPQSQEVNVVANSIQKPQEPINPTTARSIKEDFDIKKTLINNYLQDSTLSNLAKNNIIGDADLDTMANLEIQGGPKAREKYVDNLLKGKPPLNKLNYQEPKPQSLPQPDLPASEQRVKQGNAFDRTIANRRSELQESLHKGYNVNDIMKVANDRLQTREASGPKNDIKSQLNINKIREAFSNPKEGIEKLANLIADERAITQERERLTEETGEQYSITPTQRFVENTEKLKQKVQEIAKRINPKVSVKFAGQLFGEGEKLRDSGADSTNRQEVAGTFSRLRNLMEVSLDTSKFDPENTAYHEAWHSIEKMLSDEDKAVLDKYYPGNKEYSATEQRAIAFADWAQRRNLDGMVPAVRRVFSRVMQFLRSLGTTLKLGNFNSIDDIFSRAESGDVSSKYRAKIKESVQKADINQLRELMSNPEVDQSTVRDAVREASPALYDVVYNKNTLTDEDHLDLADRVADATNNPEDVLYSITGRVFSAAKPDKEKILRRFEKAVSPFLPEKVAKKMVEDVQNNLKHTAAVGSKRSKIGAGETLVRNLVQSNDGSLRFVGNRFKSKAIAEVANFFYHSAGIAGSVEKTYFEAIDDYVNRNMNKLAKAIENLNEKELEQITDILQNPDKPFKFSPKVKNAAGVIGKMMIDQRKYLKDAGLEIKGEQKGYFPRVYDAEKIISDPTGFIKKASLAYKRTFPEMTDEEITERAERWLDNILKQEQMGHDVKDNDFHVLSDLPPVPDESKARVLVKEADEILKDYMLRNPVDVITFSVQRAARAAEFNRRLGKEQWTRLKAEMRKEGVDREGLAQVVGAIRSNTGMIDTPRGALNNTLSNLRYWSNIMFLPQAALSSLTEGFTVATKTGNPWEGLKTMVDGWRDLPDLRAKAEAYGLIGEMAEMMTMIQMTGGDFQDKKLNYKTKRFFDRIALTPLTRRQIAATTRAGQFAIGKWADQITNNQDRKKSAEFMVSELGVPKDKINEFAKWVTDNGGGELKTEFGLGETEFADIYRTALRRFVTTTIQIPTPATRQRYASTPIGQFVYGLTSFINAFSKNVLIRNTRLAKEAFKDGYTVQDRVAFLSQTAMLLPLMLLAGGLRDLRDELNPYSKPKTTKEKVFSYIQSGNLLGGADPYINIFRGLAYGKHPTSSLTGALPSKMGDILKTTGNFIMNNSSRTNTAERQMVKHTYEALIAPALTSIIATNSPFGVPAYIAIQAMNHPATKGAIQDAVAGKERKQRERRRD